MNARDEARLRAEVMLAYARGEEVQCLPRLDGGKWSDIPPWAWPRWDWDHHDYRVKPDLVENWCVVNTVGDWRHYMTRAEADQACRTLNSAHPALKPHRVVHMREVME